MILQRLLISAAIILLGWLVYRLHNRFLLARSMDRFAHIPGLQPGKPAILYFTTPSCRPCQTVQKPALRALQEQLGEQVHIIEVNAAEQQELACQWRVLSVPTTFVIDARGKTRFVNQGAAGLDQLLHQLGQVSI